MARLPKMSPQRRAAWMKVIRDANSTTHLKVDPEEHLARMWATYVAEGRHKRAKHTRRGRSQMATTARKRSPRRPPQVSKSGVTDIQAYMRRDIARYKKTPAGMRASASAKKKAAAAAEREKKKAAAAKARAKKAATLAREKERARAKKAAAAAKLKREKAAAAAKAKRERAKAVAAAKRARAAEARKKKAATKAKKTGTRRKTTRKRAPKA